MKRKFFANVRKVEEAHELYRQYAKQFHPDSVTNEEEKADAHEKFVAMKEEYEQLVQRLTSVKNERKHVERFSKKMDKTVQKITVEKAHAKRITFHASKLAGVVAEAFVTNVAKKVLQER